jgi:outer membrane protein TolC
VFDAQLQASMLWERNEQPRNVRLNQAINQIFVRNFEQDQATFQAQIAKTAATGARFSTQWNTIYDLNNNPSRDVPSDYNVSLQGEIVQPLLQGAGVMFNRIASPNASPGNYTGVVIARISGDITLADFEGQVQEHVRQVEDAYWDLYGAYRAFDAARIGRDAVLKTWRRVQAFMATGFTGGEALEEARARNEYFAFKAQVEDALCRLYAAENRLRFLMGLAASDGRLIRPIDEPTTARVDFDWCEINGEALARNVALRRQKWQIKRREMELIASKNFLLPRLDAVARYRWLGLGDRLIDPNGFGIDESQQSIAGTNAFSTLTSGDYQEWEMGLQFSMPIGFRRELSGVRHAELQLARDRAVLQDQELSVSHLVTESVRNLHCNYALVETTFNRGIAAKREVEAAQALFVEGVELRPGGGISTLDRLLDAERRYADAIREYYRLLVEYNQSITEVHFRKGSLLEYNNIYLAEGPWPLKAYYDAQELARKRDAGHFINYGYTRPSVFSRGPYDQFSGQHAAELHGAPEPTLAEPIPAGETPDAPLPETNGNPPSNILPPSPTPMAPAPAAHADESGPRLSAAGVGGTSSGEPQTSDASPLRSASQSGTSSAMNWKPSRR